MKASELDYALPDALIAREPPEERDGARLLALSRETGALRDLRVRDLPEVLPPRSLLVVNDTRVIPARLFATKASGGKVELLLLERVAGDGAEETWTAMARGLKSLRDGAVLTVGDALHARVVSRGTEEVTLALTATGETVHDAIARVGSLPLPPYLGRAATAADAERYQTVFAREEGAVAAPTAGLHLSPRLLAALDTAGHTRAAVTLHVGPGTFLPLRSEELTEHVMHEERFRISADTSAAIAAARAARRPIVAVGTTVVRTLESVAREDGTVPETPLGRTAIFLYPPYRFRAVDALLTNFHLPRSTLLALVMAFGGIEPVRAAYAHAVREKYRFYSYGDAMLLV